MASQASANNPPNVPDPFTPLQQLVSQIDSESHAKEVIDKARDLNAKEQQLLVDVLSTTLNKSKILSQWHAHTWSEYIVTGSDASACTKVVRQIQDDTSVICHEKLVEWAHLSHLNILPLYAMFLESEDRPSFVSPSTSTIKICDHAQSLTSDQRLPLILDIINGLCHLHQLNIVHSGLGPLCSKETVLVSVEGRALITDLDVTSKEEDSSVLSIRYSAPELSRAQPDQDGCGGSAISDMTWDLVMTCWEYEAMDRPTSSKLQEMLSRMHSGDSCPEPGSIIEPEAIKCSIIDVELAKTILSQILSSHQAASLQVPKHLHDILSWLIHDSKALDAAKVAAKKLNHDDTQTIVDFIELVIKDLPYLPKSNFTGQLLQDIMEFTHIFPQYYRASGVQYDPTQLLSESFEAKLYEGRVLKIHVCIADSSLTKISDVVSGLAYLHNVMGQALPDILTTKGVVISDEGRALVISFYANYALFPKMTYELWDVYTDCFYDPGKGVFYSFGCLSYQAEVLHGPLSELIENHTKDVVATVVELKHNDIQTIVNFLDQALKEHLSISEERNRVLAILSRITSSTLIFPQRYELKGIKYDPHRFIAQGGCGAVYQGTDPSMCIKLMKQLNTGALTPWIKEVILWAHSSHPNVLPFLGILDVVNGLQYLHGLGIVHGDLKGQNVLISAEGRGLITDFGTSHVNTATAFSGKLSSTTLCFTAPEAILGDKKPTKEFDIWSLGCLFYETLSRKSPYYQYSSEVQIFAALSRKELPKRPGSIDDNDEERDEYDWDDDIKQDCDAIDDQAWNLIVKCCAPQPKRRPSIVSVHELVIDLKIRDDRPAVKAAPGAGFLKSRVEPKIDLRRMDELLTIVQVLSRKPPYHQYKSEVQIIAALTRKEMPKRPGSIDDNDAEKDEYGWDDDIEEDYDAIDDQMWSLIVKCCASEPEARPDIANVQELVVDMKIYDDRPAVKDAPGASILKSRVNPKIDLTRVEELFDQVKEKLAALPKNGSTDA
ncbi:Mitogen-activated protein kinase kinase kinase YODA [Leucoagaricus sp. SymC.cos]|nr:Mitogen-activated protein kinase kinase kinase YODA [Leucoagaricus sp. SymC.cos]